MIGSALDLDVPTPSDTMADVVAKTAAALSDIEDVLEQRVTPASLNINAALPFGGNQITGLGAAIFSPAAIPDTPGSMYYTDGEFWLVDAAGPIQVTENGDLNLGATGTIVGDYGGANPARVTYDDASGEYRFTEDMGVYADLVCDDVILHSAAGSVRLGVTNDITTARSVLFKELASSGVSLFVYDTATSTVEMAETKRVTNGILCTSIDAAGTVFAPDYHFSAARSKRLVPKNGINGTGTVSVGTTIDGIVTWTTIGNGEYYLHPLLVSGDRPQTVVLRLNKTSGGNISVALYRHHADGSTTLIQSGFTYSTFGIGNLTCTITSPVALATGEDLLIAVTVAAVGDQIRGGYVTYDRP